MKEEKSIGSKIISAIIITVLLIIVYKLFTVYEKYYFCDFQKAEYVRGKSKFVRDSEEKYTEEKSYKIESLDFNDAVFYKTIEVEPNTPYRVSCMVKTSNVISEDEQLDSGATICILDTTEISESISGTQDWQKLEFMFNSKNNKTIDIGFRLGGNVAKAKGEAWFTDFKIEQGMPDTTSSWKIGCFIFKSIDVELEGQNIELTMTDEDIYLTKNNMKRFKGSCAELSANRIYIDYDIYEVEEILKKVSYSDEHGYYIDPYDVNDIIGDKVLEKSYDHIFVVTRLGSKQENVEIPVKGWIGLRRNGPIWNRFF